MKQLNNLKVGLRSAVATGLITIGVMALPLAQASITMGSTGGVACQATNGNGAKLFNFGNLEAWNTSAATQFLSCGGLSNINPALGTIEAQVIFVGLTNPTGADMTFTCAIQAGYVTNAGGLVNTAVYNWVAVAASTGINASTPVSSPATPDRPDSISPYTMSCSVPAQGKVGLLSVTMPGTIT